MREELKKQELRRWSRSAVDTLQMIIVCKHHNDLGLSAHLFKHFKPEVGQEYSSRIQSDFLSLYDKNILVHNFAENLKSQIITTLRYALLSCLMLGVGIGVAYLLFTESWFLSYRHWALLTVFFCISSFAGIHAGDIYYLLRWKRAINHLERLHDDTYFAPSHHGEYLLWLLLPQQSRDAILGDLNEGFGKVAEQHGLPHAKFWYWCQALRSTGPLLGRLLEMLFRLALHK